MSSLLLYFTQRGKGRKPIEDQVPTEELRVLWDVSFGSHAESVRFDVTLQLYIGTVRPERRVVEHRTSAQGRPVVTPGEKVRTGRSVGFDPPRNSFFNQLAFSDMVSSKDTETTQLVVPHADFPVGDKAAPERS